MALNLYGFNGLPCALRASGQFALGAAHRAHGRSSSWTSPPHGATRKSNAIPGSASAVHNRKKLNHPICATMKPVVALISVLGTAERLVKSANWVAVNRGSVARAMNA